MRRIKISSLSLAIGLAFAPKAFSADVLIYNGDYSDVANSLAARQTVAGNTPTVISWTGNSIPGLPSLNSYQQVWDVNGHLALTSDQQAAYQSYLQRGGVLFLMGENTSYGAARNATLISFISSVGGGTLSIVGNGGGAETVSSAMQSPNAINSVSYAASGSYTSPGTGTCLTVNGSNTCSAIAFSKGRLANATSGALVSVLDINFLESSRAASFQSFVDNLIAYMTAQANSGAQFSPFSSSTSSGVAGILDKLTTASTIDTGMAQAIGQLSALSPAEKSTTLSRLTPTANSSLANLAPAATNTGIATIGERLEGLHAAGANAWAERSKERWLLAAAGPVRVLPAQNDFTHGFWAKVFAGNTRQDAKDGYAGYRATTQGMTLGADSRVEPGSVVGAALTYVTTSLNQQDFMTGSGNDLDSYLLTGYASRDLGEWYLDSMLSYGRQRYSSHRDTTLTGVAKATYSGDQWAAKVTANVPYKIGETLALTPFASLQYNRIRQDGYSENGAGALDLKVEGTTAERVQSGLGAKLSGKMDLGRTKLLPSVHAQWVHDFKDGGIGSTASLEGGGGVFYTPGQAINRNKLNLGGSLAFQTSRDTTLAIQYEYEGASGYRSQTGKLVGQWMF